MISIYCDGSSSGKSNKPGGWAYVIVDGNGNILTQGSGGERTATNNTMELTAAIEGIKACVLFIDSYSATEVSETKIELVSDSQYVLGIASGEYLPKKNLQLASDLKKLYTGFKLTGRWVRGHNGDKWNEFADKLAKSAKEKLENET